MDYSEAFDIVATDDCTVGSIKALAEREDIPETTMLKMCVVHLSQLKHELVGQVLAMAALQPRKIKTPDGTIYRYDAPDEMVPIEASPTNPPKMPPSVLIDSIPFQDTEPN